MKGILAIICFFLIVTLWNWIPYDYMCYEYPLVGCDDSDFWWNLPTEWDDYKGVRWSSYFTTNGIVSALIIIIYGKLTK